MKQSFLSKFSRSSGSAPAGWPSDDVFEIDASAVEMKKITSDLIKKLLMFLPPAGITGGGFLESDKLSNGLASSFTGNNNVLCSPSFRSALRSKASSSGPVEKEDASGILSNQHLILETSNTQQRTDLEMRRKFQEMSETPFSKSLPNENYASTVDGCLKQPPLLEEDVESKNAVETSHVHFKKIPESVLARSCLESSERLSHLQPTLSHLFFGCGQAASQLACARLNWGNRVQSSVVAPLRRIAEAAAPNGELVKTRRQAWRAGGELRSVSERAARAAAASTSYVGVNDSTEEMSPLVQSQSSLPLKAPVFDDSEDSSRHQSSAKNTPIEKSLSDLSSSSKSLSTPIRSPAPHKASLNCARPSQVTSSAGNGGSTSNVLDEDRSQKALIRTAKATQLNAIKQDLEVEAQLMKEKALHELYNFESMSILECGKALVDFVEISASYHRTCVAILEELSPMLKEELDEQCPLPVFGRQLETHLQATGRRIAYPIKVCVRALNKPRVLAEEGLFRIAGSKKKVDTLQSALNTLRAESIIDQYDSFVIADVLKQYLRRLPEPLLTRKLFAEWTAIQHISGTHLQVAHLCQTASKLPEASRVNAGYLFRFLQELAKNADKNRMTATNLGIILGPTLLSPPLTVDNDVRDNRKSSKADAFAGNNRQNFIRMKSSSPDSIVAKSNGVSDSLTCVGSRGGVIELLITYADEIFPDIVDEDMYDLDNVVVENEDPFAEIETQLPAGVYDSASSKDLQTPDGSQNTPRLIHVTELGRRTQRCRNEFSRQGRVFRSLPQRLKGKHYSSTSSSTPRGLHPWQALFTGRQQSSQTPACVVSSPTTKCQLSPHSAPSTRRSLTPVLSAADRSRNTPINVTGSTTRGPLPDRDARIVSRQRQKAALHDPAVLRSAQTTTVPLQSRLPGAENANAGAASSEDSSWKQATSRYGVYYGDSLSLDSHLTMDEVEPQQEARQYEERTQTAFPHPRSDLQRRYQEWRKAMLDNSEEVAPLGSKFFHGDLYDTLFTLQTLNSVSGLENFLTRVRSVYEAGTAINKPTEAGVVVTKPVPKSAQGACDTLGKVTVTSMPITETTLYETRRHSISSLVLNEQVDTALPRPINPALQRHYRKSLTSPSCMKPRQVSIPISPEPVKRMTNTLPRVEVSQRTTTSPLCEKSTPQLPKKNRSSCAARLGIDTPITSFSGESRDRCMETGTTRSSQPMTPKAARASNTLPRMAAESIDADHTVRSIRPSADNGRSTNASTGRHPIETTANAEGEITKIFRTAESLPTLDSKPCVHEDTMKT